MLLCFLLSKIQFVLLGAATMNFDGKTQKNHVLFTAPIQLAEALGDSFASKWLWIGVPGGRGGM